MNIKIISASAGTGKTYRLTEILSQEIRNGSVRPENVIATTFTVKAARELRERVRKRLLQDGLADEAIRLRAARIGTVNSICAQIVSDFAMELGISPELDVITDEEVTDAVNRSLSLVMRRDDLKKLLYFETLFVAYDSTGYQTRTEIRQLVFDMISKARLNRIDSKGLYEHADRSVKTFLQASGLSVPHDNASSHLDAIHEELKQRLEDFFAVFNPDDDATQITAKVVDRAKKAFSRLRNGRHLSWDQFRQLTGLPGASTRELYAPVAECASGYFASPAFGASIVDLTRFVFDLAARTLDAYQEYKRARGVMDYVDQEVYALELLQLPHISSVRLRTCM